LEKPVMPRDCTDALHIPSQFIRIFPTYSSQLLLAVFW
jgi:hypothetical protein